MTLVTSKDVLHLYYPYADIRCTFDDGEILQGRLTIHTPDGMCFGQTINGSDLEIELDNKKMQVHLILDQTLDLTDKQKREYNLLCHRNTFKQQGITWMSDTPMSLWWLLKNGVDAFNLITNGEAVHKKTGLIAIQDIAELSDETTYLGYFDPKAKIY